MRDTFVGHSHHLGDDRGRIFQPVVGVHFLPHNHSSGDASEYRKSFVHFLPPVRGKSNPAANAEPLRFSAIAGFRSEAAYDLPLFARPRVVTGLCKRLERAIMTKRRSPTK